MSNKRFISNIIFMYLKAKDQVKILLVQENMLLKVLADKLSNKMNKKYAADNLSQKLRRGSFSYDEMLLIAEILGYDINFVKK